jgi:hypothetical protein
MRMVSVAILVMVVAGVFALARRADALAKALSVPLDEDARLGKVREIHGAAHVRETTHQ